MMCKDFNGCNKPKNYSECSRQVCFKEPIASPQTEQAEASSLSDLLSAMAGLVTALEEITYEDSGVIKIGMHGDSNCTDEVKPALDEAKRLITSSI